MSILRADPVVKTVNPSVKVEVFLLDFNYYKYGINFVQKVKEEASELDVLMYNGGMSIMN